MSDENGEEKEVIEPQVESVRKVIHEIKHVKDQPKPNESKLQEKLDKRDAQMVSLISHNLEIQKDFSVDKFPEHKSRIEATKSEDELNALLLEFEDSTIPARKPSGRATLPPTREPSSLDEADDYGSLINQIYREKKKHGKSEHKQEAEQKSNQLFDGLKNTSLSKMERVLSGTQYSICPNCDGVVNLDEHDINVKGAECPFCHRRTGVDKIKRKY